MGNDEERQKNSQRQQPDEGSPSTTTAVALVTGRANQRDEKQAKNRTDTWGYDRGNRGQKPQTRHFTEEAEKKQIQT